MCVLGSRTGVQDLYYLAPYKNSEVFDRWIEGLIKAGLKVKGDPSDYYKVHQENKMTGKEIRELIFGKTMSGKVYGYPWSVKINKNGECDTTSFLGVYKGKAWISGDALCSQYETRFDGLKSCSDIYKNPEGDKKTLSEYLSLTDYGLLPFSIEE